MITQHIMVLCSAITRSGTRCKKHARPNGFCGLHAPVDPVPVPVTPLVVAPEIKDLVTQLITRFREVHPKAGWRKLLACVAEAWTKSKPKSTRPMTRYQSFVQENMPELVRMYPGRPQVDRMRLVAQMWRQLKMVPVPDLVAVHAPNRGRKRVSRVP